MKKLNILLVLIALIYGCASATKDNRNKDLSYVGKEYYTRTNIWYKDQTKISNVNYIDGIFLPLGTKIKILEYDGVQVKFVDINRGQNYTIIFTRKHTTINSQEQFDRYFSENNAIDLKGDFYKLSSREQGAIKRGVIFEGMSRKAVLMALGYPPSHKTPDLKSNVWLYWGRRVVFSVYFRDDVVVKSDSEIRGRGPFNIKVGSSNESLTK